MEQELIEKSKKLFEENIKTENIKQHCIEVEAIMRELAKEEGEDEEKWAAAGLLHDLDFEEVKDLETHGKKTIEVLNREGYPADLVHAVASHNPPATGVNRETKFDYALSASDNISGLIYAYALIRKNIDGMTVEKLKKRMKEKAFAANCNREEIKDIEKAGIELDKFLEVAIRAMQSIKDKIGF